jgi:carbon-monoxide dehydrogenase small subunit
MSPQVVSLTVNDRPVTASVDVRVTLSDLLRDHLDLTGTHVGCEQGACGTCTVLVDGVSVRSCLMFAVQADGAHVTTVEGLAGGDELHPLQESFSQQHALQCGFCTPGMLITAVELLDENPAATREAIRDRLRGNLCRCTGYAGIIEAVAALARERGPRDEG